MSPDRCGRNVTSRRRFLSQISLAMTGSALAVGGLSVRRAGANDDSPLPAIRLGDHHVSRLIAGSNPISGYSYMGPIMDRHMREYFTNEQTVEFLWNCERAGINTHQFSDPARMAGVFRSLRERGSKMQFICLHSGQPQSMPVEQVVRDTQPIAIVHHGGVTDRLFQRGQERRRSAISRNAFATRAFWRASRPTIPTASSGSPMKAGRSISS